MTITCKRCRVSYHPDHYCRCPLCQHRIALKQAMEAIRDYERRKALRRLDWIMDGLRAEGIL